MVTGNIMSDSGDARGGGTQRDPYLHEGNLDGDPNTSDSASENKDSYDGSFSSNGSEDDDLGGDMSHNDGDDVGDDGSSSNMSRVSGVIDDDSDDHSTQSNDNDVSFEGAEDAKAFQDFEDRKKVYEEFVFHLIRDWYYQSASLTVRCAFPNAVMERMCYHLRRANELKRMEISLASNHCNPRIFPRLFVGPFNEHCLQKLELKGPGAEHFNFEVEDANAIKEYLSKTSKLSELSISGLKMEADSLRILSGMFRESKCKEFGLNDVEVESDALVEFVSNLNETNLSTVRLEKLGIGRDVCDALSNILRGNCPLVVLGLGGNNIDDDCLRPISNSLTKNTKLEHLLLLENPVTDDGLEYLGNIVYDDSSLDAAYNSNHTLANVEASGVYGNMDILSYKLILNTWEDFALLDKWVVRRKKVRKYLLKNGQLNAAPFCAFDLEILPYALSYAEKSCPDYWKRHSIIKDGFFTFDEFFQIVKSLAIQQSFKKVSSGAQHCEDENGGNKRARIA